MNQHPPPPIPPTNPEIPPSTTLFPKGLNHTHKSFLPPPQAFHYPITYHDLLTYDYHESIQRAKLFGFTIRELVACGAWDKSTAVPSNLENFMPLHPLYQRSNWEFGNQNILKGHLGKWCARTNDRLWEALQPVLRLAGLFVAKGESVWQDAMFHGKWNEVECSDGCPPEAYVAQAYEMHTRPPHERTNDWRNRTGYIQGELAKRIKLGFDCAEDAYGYHMAHFKSSIKYGLPDQKYEGVIYIVSGFVLSLMSPANVLTTSQRLAQTHLLAKTLAHETIHASMALSRTFRDLPRRGAEPFFEDEAIAEAGSSWENTTFGGSGGGIHTDYEKHKQHAPLLGEFVAPWPNWAHFDTGAYCNSTGKRFRFQERYLKPWARYDRWPVSLTHVECLQQAGYWEGMSMSQGEEFKAPLILGKCTLSQDQTRDSHTILGKDYYKWAQGPPGAVVYPMPTQPLNATVMQKFEYERALATRAATIQVAMMRQADDDFTLRNFTVYQADRTLTPAEMDQVRMIAKKRKLLSEKILQMEEQDLTRARDLYLPTFEEESIKIYEGLAQSENLSTSCRALLRLSQMIGWLDIVAKRQACMRALDELRVLNRGLPAVGWWMALLKEAEEHMVILLTRNA